MGVHPQMVFAKIRKCWQKYRPNSRGADQISKSKSIHTMSIPNVTICYLEPPAELASHRLRHAACLHQPTVSAYPERKRCWDKDVAVKHNRNPHFEKTHVARIPRKPELCSGDICLFIMICNRLVSFTVNPCLLLTAPTID